MAVLLTKLEELRQNLERVIRGKEKAVNLLVATLLAGESILIEDVPGVGKTTIAKALAASLELDFQRIQCTPDLLPADVFGVSVFKPNTGEFEFRQGPVFTNVLLVDEINRASPRTQSALLEAMAEGQVTVEGKTYALPKPFTVVATQNPIGFHGTYPLPESQLDRFVMQISMEYPDTETELAILYQEGNESDRPILALTPVLSRDEVLDLQRKVSEIHFDESLARYLLQIVSDTREHPAIELGCSPRGAINFFKVARAWALVSGREHVLPDDIQTVAPLVLRHRVVFSSGRTSPEDQAAIISELIQHVNVPV